MVKEGKTPNKMHELKILSRRKVNALPTIFLIGFDGSNDPIAEIIGRFSSRSEVVFDELFLDFA